MVVAKAGILIPAFALLAALLPASTAGGPRRTLHYWFAAVPVTWNVVPNGHDAIEHEELPPEKTRFETVVYKAFTPGWRRPLRDVPWITGDNDGIPGPLIRARVGDTVLVHFKNLDTRFGRPHSMHFHAFRYELGSDGAYIPGFSGPGANVEPGKSFTYRLVAVAGSEGVWPYHDHSPSMMDSIRGGLYGAISIRKRDEAAPDREFVVFLSSHQKLMTINGRAGEVVQWDVLALGDDHHTFHIHGHRWRAPDRTSIDTRTIGPAESISFRIREDAVGTWLYHCHVEGHMMEGMIGIYRVHR